MDEMDAGRFVPTIVTGGAVGAIGLSFLGQASVVIPSVISHRPIDGQSGMLVLVTVPIGWLLGSIIGAIVAYITCRNVRPRYAHLIAFALIVGGFLVAPIAAIPLIGFAGLLLPGAPIGLIIWLTRSLIRR